MRGLAVAALLSSVLLVSGGCDRGAPVEELPANVTGAELRARLGTVAVVDVRTPAEYAAGHIPGAWNVPVDEVARRAEEIRDRAGAQPIVVYCKAGRRAATAIGALGDAGIRASHLEGDFDAWATAGMPVEQEPDGAEPVPTERGREGWD